MWVSALLSLSLWHVSYHLAPGTPAFSSLLELRPRRRERRARAVQLQSLILSLLNMLTFCWSRIFFFFFLHWCWLQNIAIKYSFSPMTEFEAIPLKVTQWMSHLLSPSPAPMYQVACGVSPEGASACCSSSQHASLPDCVQTSAHMAPSGAALLDHPLWNNAPLPVTFCFVASQSSHLYLTWYHTFACHLYLVKCEF